MPAHLHGETYLIISYFPVHFLYITVRVLYSLFLVLVCVSIDYISSEFHFKMGKGHWKIYLL